MMRRRDHEVERMMGGGTDSRFDAFAEALRTPDGIDPSFAVADIAVAAYIAAASSSLARETPSPAVDHAPADASSWRRRVVVRVAGLGLTAKLLVSGAVAVAATGGAAAGGILPGPIQSAIADTVNHVGINLPNPRPFIAATATLPGGTSTNTLASTPASPGTYWWNGIACDGAALSTVYRVNMDGTLELVAAAGDAGHIDEGDDLIRVGFDGVDVDIRIDGDALTVDEDRECDSDGGTRSDDGGGAPGNGPGQNNGNGPGQNNGNGPNQNNGNGNGPGQNNGNGPGQNNGNGPDKNNGTGNGPGQNNGNGPDKNNGNGNGP